MMVLDLSTYEEKYIEIKWTDGRIFLISKPTQEQVIAFMILQNKIQPNTEDSIEKYKEYIEALNRFIFKILVANKNGTIIEYEDVLKLPVDMKILIIKSYTNFLKEIQNDPN